MRIAAIDDTPIGTETVAKLFEDPLLGEIELYHHNKLRAFLKPYIAKYTNVEEVRKIITDDIPAKWTLDKRAEVLQNFKEAETVNVVFDRYFNLNGKASIEALFPLN
ncbi:hypothetical protein CCAX7_12460 [Capsulimonas corticalis]|uniref:Uncharacterized protein n=2 Tax=Capsulimonas corticalis TaxID=2219043 RepID=A0A9N7Q9G5_9BACT|nr:hypothetical protein CCAX7_12460 [Capsulimonas corticalis]